MLLTLNEAAAELARQRRAAGALLGAGLAVAVGLLVLLPVPWEVPGGPAFFEGDERRGIRDNLRIALWWTTIGNAIAVAGLLATLRIWLRPVPATPRAPRTPRALWIWVLVVCALALALRAPLASRSLWWDEGWSVRRVIVGGHDVQPGAAEPGPFEAIPLHHTFFNYRKPTNHPLYSIAARGSVSLWRSATGAAPEAFSELAVRAPSLIASVATIVFVAALLGRAGAPWAAALAAVWLALHPWQIRYGIDGRGYGIVMAGTAASLFFLARFLAHARWRDALGIMATQIAMVWSWPYAAFVTAGTCITGFAWIATARAAHGERIARAGRFFVAHLFAVMVVLTMLGPNLTQVGEWDYRQPVVTAEKLWMTWSQLATGTPWSLRGSAAGFSHAAADEQPWIAAWVVGIVPLLALAGALAAFRRGGIARAVGCAVPLAVGLAVVVNWALTQQYFARFLSFALPALVAAASLGAVTIGEGLARKLGKAPATGAAIAALVVILGFGSAVAPTLRNLLTRPYAPLRDVAHALTNGREANAISAGFGSGGWMLSLYAPTVRSIQTETQLVALCEEVRRRSRPLYLALGYRDENRKRAPDAVHWIEGEAFERIARFAGIDPRFDTVVYRYDGGACPEAPTDASAPGPVQGRALAAGPGPSR